MAGRPWTGVPDDLPHARREFVLALRALCQEAGYPSLAALAEQTSLTKSSISRYLSGKNLPSHESFLELVRLLRKDESQTEHVERLWQQAAAESGPAPSKPWADSPLSGDATDARELFATLKRDARLSVRDVVTHLEATGTSVSRSAVDRALHDPVDTPLLAMQVADVLINQLPERRRGAARDTTYGQLFGVGGKKRSDVPGINADHVIATGTSTVDDHLMRGAGTARNARGSGSVVRRILLGSHLRRLREMRGITREAAGYSIRSSESRISRMELGRVSFKTRDVEDLLTLYGISDEGERAAIVNLAREASTDGWWHSYSDVLPTWFATYVGLEGAASLIRAYETHYVHGLLQTEAYAAALIRQGMKGASVADIERRVAVRLERQKCLVAENAPNLHIVLDEAALRRSYGDRSVMHGQLQHLIEVSERPNVRLQIMPFSSGGHPGAPGAFTILSFPEAELADVVYIEQLTSALYLDKSEDVAQYAEAYRELQQDSPGPDASRDLLRGLLQLS